MSFRKGHLLILCFLFSGIVSIVCQEPERDYFTFELSRDMLEDIERVIIEFHSDRNSQISKLSDISENNMERRNPGMVPGKDMWFPVIDLQLSDAIEAIAIIKHFSDGDTYSWNSNFWSNSALIEDTLVFSNHLEHWENHLFIESETAMVKEFYLRKEIEVSSNIEDADPERKVYTLSPGWSGEVKVFGLRGTEKTLLKEIDISNEVEKNELVVNSTLSEEDLMGNLCSTIQYILDCQNVNPLSPTYGGLFLFYDLDATTYRRSDWIWTYGPAIKLLLDAARIPKIVEVFGYERLHESARLIGEASLRFQVLDKSSPAYGLTICRFDPRMIYEEGFSGYASPADAQFLAGYGWIPLYEVTGDSRFLDAAILQSEQIARIMEGDTIVEQDYVFKEEQWKNWTMDESGFGVIGFSEVYKHTQIEKHKEIGRDYLDGLINVLEGPDGVWYRTWHRNRTDHTDDCWPISEPKGTPVLMKNGQTTRGNGWVMIGLLAAHGMMPENDYYLDKAVVLATSVIEQQMDNGAFPFSLDVDYPKVGISEKGTSLWSMLLFQLYRYSGNPKHLQAAHKALKWCTKNRYSGADNLAAGGIAGDTWASGIVYRNYYSLICTYTMDWYGLAILEQLRLYDE